MTPSRDAHRIASTDLPDVRWRKSSRSNNGGSCVEAATDGLAHLARDSKDPHSPVLVFTRPEWAALLHTIKSGALDLPVH